MKFVMIDTQTSNLRSVGNAFRRAGAEIATTTRPEDIETAQAIVLPGVGAFEPAMARLRSSGMADTVRQRAGEGVPLLGICLGMQLLADRSLENGDFEGLGLVAGTVRRLDPGETDDRVPNIGWCDTTARKAGRLFEQDGDVASFYFVHSYYFDCGSPADIAATIDYGGRQTPVAVERGNILGLQFHPEKSQDAGLDLLERTIRRMKEAASCSSLA